MNSATELVAEVSVDTAATPGARDVTVTTGTETATGAGLFTVNAVVTPTGALELIKSSTTTSFNAAGQQINFDFMVRNVSDVPQTNVVVEDPLLGGTVCTVGLLSPTFEAVCTGVYFVTQADVVAGEISNTAMASSTESPTPVEAELTISSGGGVGSDLLLSKTAIPSTFSSAGEQITYTFDVTNDSQTPQNNVVVNDPLLGGHVCTVGLLSPGIVATCTGVYFTTESDVQAGTIDNSASVTSDESTTPVEASTSVSIGTPPSPVTFTKTATPASFTAAGETITYEYTVGNTGDTGLTNLMITDDKISGSVCTSSLVSPGFEMVCTALYVTTDADVSAGELTNTAVLKIDGIAVDSTTTLTIPLMTSP